MVTQAKRRKPEKVARPCRVKQAAGIGFNPQDFIAP
jgi:hypothetical protein